MQVSYMRGSTEVAGSHAQLNLSASRIRSQREETLYYGMEN